MAENVFVVALGASTSLGRDAWSSAAAVRAGINLFREHPYLIDAAGEPMRTAAADWLDCDLTGLERFEALLFPAIDDAIEPLREHAHAASGFAIAVGLPAPRAGLSANLQREVMVRVGTRYGRIFATAAAFPAGHAAGLIALQAGFRKLQRGELDACLVAGVDSYLFAETLEWLEVGGQLHGAGAMNNAWGFIPGEAAGAVLLARDETVARIGLQPLARLLGTGSAMEHKRIKTDSVCTGQGLTQAFREALAALPDGERVSDVYCDMNGEPYRADEYGFACLRTKEAFASASDFLAPADCWGDVGAASGALHVMLSAIAGVKSYAHGGLSFAWASSEGGERAAALLATGGSVGP